jgi:hypothetical protein
MGACGTGGGGSGGGGGGSGGCGGEAIGVAVEALTGCCCVVPATGDPGQCRSVGDPSECSLYNQYSDGQCNPAPGPICSASGVPFGAGGLNGVEVFVLLLALGACRAMRRRFA